MTNNKNILFIEDNGYKFADKFNATSIRYENQVTDLEIETWLIHLFNDNQEADRIVIPIQLGKDDIDYIGLRIGLHIRLTQELGKARFIPIVFLSDDTKEILLFQQFSDEKEKTATLLDTPNCKIVEFEENSINRVLANFKKPLDEERFKLEGLSKIVIDTHRDTSHQLANEWGCIRFAKLAGYEMKEKLSADLYFKYRLAKMSSDIGFQAVVPTNLLSQNINVLLIDDNADKGWAEVIKVVLEKYVVAANCSVNLETIKSEKDFNNRTIDIETFDIVLLDLRLSKDEDNPSLAIKIEDFSGSKVLKNIKKVNRGIQTIMLTASNKAWNMKYLLDAGADGYYIKESPEVIVTNEFSTDSFNNFIESVKSCLNRQYLKEFFKSHRTIKNKLDTLMTTNPDFKDALEEMKIYFDVSFEMVYAASSESDAERKKNRFGFAYISLFSVVERINKYYKAISGLSTFPNYYYQTDSKIHPPISTQNYASGTPKANLSEFETMAWICKDILSLSSQPFIKQVYWSIHRRNKFIHADGSLTTEEVMERDKIYTHEGYQELLKILEAMITNTNFS